MTLRPCATRSRVALNTRSISGLLSVAVGSSRMSRRASRTSRRAISTSCRSPIESDSTAVPSCTWRRPSWSRTLARVLGQTAAPVDERHVEATEIDVVLDAELGDEAELLVHERDPVRLRVVRVPERDLLAVEADHAFVRLGRARRVPSRACSCRRRCARRSRGPRRPVHRARGSARRAPGRRTSRSRRPRARRRRRRVDQRRTGSGRRCRIPFAVHRRRSKRPLEGAELRELRDVRLGDALLLDVGDLGDLLARSGSASPTLTARAASTCGACVPVPYC